MDTGIGRDGYSIIGQGKIDQILSNKSENRRHIFEEAAGIVKYRVRKEESEKKLERTKLNLLRINDILTEIEANIEPLKAQSEKAKQYLTLREELKNIEIGLFLHNIEKYKKELEGISENEKIIVQNYKDEETKLEKIKKDKEELKAKIEEITQKIEDMSNVGFESQKEIEQLNSEISVANTRKINNDENSERFKKEIEELKEKIKDFNAEIEQKKEKKGRLKENKARFEKELNEKEEELKRLTSKLSEKELEIEGYKQKVEQNVDKKYELQSDINTNEINHENYVKRQKQIENEIQNNISELDASRIKKSDISKQFQEIDNKHSKLVKQIEEASEETKEANKKIDEFEKLIQMSLNDMRIKESKLKFLIETEKEKEGYIRSVKSLLKDCENIKDLGKGMHGVLANVIKGTQKGVIGIASDLIKYSKKYEQIIISLLGRTVIVDNMDTAIKVAKQNGYSFRIITIEGDLINPSGAITGGSVTKKTVNILGRGREIEKLEKDIKKIKEKIEKTKDEKTKYEKRNYRR